MNFTYSSSQQDYYPFGWKLPGRQTTGSENYRYGYQGQFAEEDHETQWNQFELRMWDGRIGRWMSTDPYGQYFSPYLGMGNNPVSSVDPDGGCTSCADCPEVCANGDMFGGNIDEIVVVGYSDNSPNRILGALRGLHFDSGLVFDVNLNYQAGGIKSKDIGIEGTEFKGGTAEFKYGYKAESSLLNASIEEGFYYPDGTSIEGTIGSFKREGIRVRGIPLLDLKGGLKYKMTENSNPHFSAMSAPKPSKVYAGWGFPFFEQKFSYDIQEKELMKQTGLQEDINLLKFPGGVLKLDIRFQNYWKVNYQGPQRTIQP